MVTKRVGPNISQITLPNLHSASLYHVILETLYKNKEKEISTAEEKTGLSFEITNILFNFFFYAKKN